MKNLRQDAGDSIRPEYKRADFSDMVTGKHAATQLEFAELVHLLLTCIGEDEGFTFVHHSPGNYPADHRTGDWTSCRIHLALPALKKGQTSRIYLLTTSAS